ncbi:MAG: oxidoreductase [Acidimicrobiales bacterium]
MKGWTAADIGDQSGRTAVVTGANSGLGFETSAALAAHGAKVIMASRHRDRLATATEEIRRRHRAADVEPVLLDLASLSAVGDAARSILATSPSIDTLIDNAGVMAIPRAETVDGFEMQLGTNYLGHFALTGLLLPAMASTPGSRVVVVTSVARRIGRIDVADLHGRRRYGRWAAYGQSKLAVLVFAVELERRLRASKSETIALAAHPGYAATNLQRGSGGLRARFGSLAGELFAQSAAAGSWPQLYAATAGDAHGGELYGPGGLSGMRGHPRRERIEARALDACTGRRLWEASVSETHIAYEALSS